MPKLKDKQTTQRLPYKMNGVPYRKRKEEALRLLKLHWKYEDIRGETGLAFATLSRMRRALPLTYQKQLRDGVRGKYLQGDLHTIERASVVLNMLKKVSGSSSQLKAIIGLEPLLSVISDYHRIPESQRGRYLDFVKKRSQKFSSIVGELTVKRLG